MNPRHRRMLIPGLLIALLVIVAVASLTGRADASEPERLSVVSDARITESSGLAVSAVHDDLAYTINDSGHDPLVYAVRLSTGETVGVTRVTGTALVDPEALALRDGRLWIADTGDNTASRDDIALVSLDEPGPGDQLVTGTRHPVALDEPADIEALLIDPAGETLFLVTKTIGSGTVYRVPIPEQGETLRPERMDVAAPPVVTDGAIAPNGSSIALVSYLGVQVLDPLTWELRESLPLPPLEQAESLAFLDSRTMIVGSEGQSSPLFAIELPPVPVPPIAVAALPAAGLLALVAYRLLPLR